MGINKISPTLFTTSTLIADTYKPVGGSSDSIPSITVDNDNIPVSAALEIQSTLGALLFPRMTTTQRLALLAANGMIVYDNVLNAYYAYQNGSWQVVAAGTGVGDVIGPASAVPNNLSMFADASGKLIADSGISVSDVPVLSAFNKSLDAPNLIGKQIGNLNYIQFINDVGTVFVDSLTAAQFIINDFGPDNQVCTLITGELPDSSTSPSALLELKSTTGALLISRMTTTQRLALVATNGMIVYDTTLSEYYVYKSSSWQVLAAGGEYYGPGNPTYLKDTSNISLFNIFVGTDAGNDVMTGSENTGVGYGVLLNNTSGIGNTVMGSNVLHNNTTGFSNYAYGWQALFTNTTGSSNCAYGDDSLYLSNSTDNAAYGSSSLSSLTSGSQNTGVGSRAGLTKAQVQSCTFLGYNADASVDSINSSTAIGAGASVGASNATAVGANAVANTANTVILGSSANIGIGTSTPSSKLDVVGNISLTGDVHLKTNNTGFIVDSSSTGDQLMHWDINVNASNTGTEFRFGRLTNTSNSASLVVFTCDNTVNKNHQLTANNSRTSFICGNNGMLAVGTPNNPSNRKLLVAGTLESSDVLYNTLVTDVSAIGTASVVFSGGVSIAKNLGIGGLTSGSVTYINSSKIIAEDHSNFFWDSTNHRLGIGNAAPTVTLDVTGSIKYSGSLTTPFTLGSVIFAGASGVLAQDNSNLFWNDTNNYLGIGNAAPATTLHVTGDTTNEGNVYFSGNNKIELLSVALGNKVLNFEINADNTATSATFRFFRQSSIGPTATGSIEIYKGDTTSALNHKLFSNNSNISFICADNGTLAIGAITNPNTRKLFVSGTLESSDVLYNTLATDVSAIGTASVVFTGGVSVAKNIGVGGLTSGSVTYINSSKILAEDHSNFFWDATNHRLGIGNAAPTVTLDVTGSIKYSGSLTTNLTLGSVAFAGTAGLLTQDNANFFWDDGNNRLGIGNSTPTVTLDVTGSIKYSGSLITPLTQGAVTFISSTGILSQDVNFFFWDISNQRLGIGMNNPSESIETNGNIKCVVSKLSDSLQVYISNAFASLNHKLFGAGSAISYLCANNGTLAIGATTNPNTRKLFVSGTLESSDVLYNTLVTDVSAIGTASVVFTGGVSVAKNLGLGGLTSGSVTYINSSKIVAEDHSNFFWDATNHRLGIGNAAPTVTLDVTGSAKYSGTLTTPLTLGSVAFIGASGALTQDNANFFWDDTNNRLGIGNAAPVSPLHITGDTKHDGDVYFSNNRQIGVISTSTGNQVLNFEISPNGTATAAAFRFFRQTSIGSLNGALEIYKGDTTTTINHSLIANNSATSYLCANNGNLTVGSSTNNASAILSADSTTLGFLPPRMTKTQRVAISSAASGLMVYDSTNDCVYYKKATTSTNWMIPSWVSFTLSADQGTQGKIIWDTFDKSVDGRANWSLVTSRFNFTDQGTYLAHCVVSFQLNNGEAAQRYFHLYLKNVAGTIIAQALCSMSVISSNSTFQTAVISWPFTTTTDNEQYYFDWDDVSGGSVASVNTSSHGYFYRIN